MGRHRIPFRTDPAHPSPSLCFPVLQVLLRAALLQFSWAYHEEQVSHLGQNFSSGRLQINSEETGHGGLNEKCPPEADVFGPWSLAIDALWKSYGISGPRVCLEEIHQRGWQGEIYSFTLLSVCVPCTRSFSLYPLPSCFLGKLRHDLSASFSSCYAFPAHWNCKSTHFELFKLIIVLPQKL